MYLRCNLQPRAEQNLSKYTQIYAEREAEGNRVTKGHVLSKLLASYPTYICGDAEKLKASIFQSDEKIEGSVIQVNLNITENAYKKLNELKTLLDKETGRSLFPAQVVDILLICVLKTEILNTESEIVKDIDNKELAKCLLDYAYILLTAEKLPANLNNAKNGLVTVLRNNFLL